MCAHTIEDSVIIILFYCGSYIVNITLYTEIQTGSSAGAGAILIIIGVMLGVLVFAAVAVFITISAILCLMKKGIILLQCIFLVLIVPRLPLSSSHFLNYMCK